MGRELDRLIVAIDELIDDELARGEQYGDIGQIVCELCGGDWHGTPADPATASEHHRKSNCPGAFANDAQRERWLRLLRRREELRSGRLGMLPERDDDSEDYADGLRFLGCAAVLEEDFCHFCNRVSHLPGGISDCPLARALDEQHANARPRGPGVRICRLRDYLD
jgi:hypothetical protein